MEELVKPIAELFCSCLGQEFGNRVELDQNVSTLKREMAELREMRDRVLERVTFAEERLQLVRTDAVASWLASVETLDEDVADIQEECLRGKEPLQRRWDAFGRCWDRWQLSRKAANKLLEMGYLKRTGDFKVVAENPQSAPVRRRRDAGGADR